MPDIYDFGVRMASPGLAFQQAFDQGRERKQKSALQQLAGDYIGGNRSDETLANIARNGGDPSQFAKFGEGQEDRKRQQLGEYAGMLVNAPQGMRPDIYRRILPQLNALGLQAPPEYTPEIDGLATQVYQQYGQNAGGGDSASLREFRAMTDGMTPEQVANARQVALGIRPRAGTESNVPFAQYKYTNAQGKEVVEVVDRRDGSSAAPNAPRQGTPGVNPANMGGALDIATRLGFRPTSVGRTPGQNAAIPGAAPNSRHLTGDAVDLSFRDKTPQEIAALDTEMTAAGYTGGIHFKGSAPHMHYSRTPGGGSPYVSRSAEEQAALTAAATEQAKVNTTLANAPAVNANDADAAAAKAKAEAIAKAQAESQIALPGALASSEQLVDVLNQAIGHPGRVAATGLSSKLDLTNKVPGTKAYDFNVLSEQIRGKAFLEAFNSLRGGGAITEKEGAAATAAIGRLNTSQSEGEYLKALRELRGIVRIGQERARQKAGQQQAAPAAGGGWSIKAIP